MNPGSRNARVLLKKPAKREKLYILVGFLKPVMKKGPNFQPMILVGNSRVVLFSRATMSATRILTTRCLPS